MTAVVVREPKSEEDFRAYYDLRWRVLRAPWGRPRGSERDDALEGESVHVMACDEAGNILGVGRLHFNSTEEAQVRSMAVEEAHRGRGVGGHILHALEERALERGAKTVVLHARESAVPFYQKNGYLVAASSYLLFGSIPHFLMRKDLR